MDPVPIQVHMYLYDDINVQVTIYDCINDYIE